MLLNQTSCFRYPSSGNWHKYFNDMWDPYNHLHALRKSLRRWDGLYHTDNCMINETKILILFVVRGGGGIKQKSATCIKKHKIKKNIIQKHRTAVYIKTTVLPAAHRDQFIITKCFYSIYWSGLECANHIRKRMFVISVVQVHFQINLILWYWWGKNCQFSCNNAGLMVHEMWIYPSMKWWDMN